MVGAKGIEPLPLPCSGSALPMSYTPLSSSLRRERGITSRRGRFNAQVGISSDKGKFFRITALGYIPGLNYILIVGHSPLTLAIFHFTHFNLYPNSSF